MGRPPSVRWTGGRREDSTYPNQAICFQRPATAEGTERASLVEQKSGKEWALGTRLCSAKGSLIPLCSFSSSVPALRVLGGPASRRPTTFPAHQRNGPSGKRRGGGGGCARHRTTTKQEKLPLGLPSPSPPFLAPVPRQMTAGLVRMMTQEREGESTSSLPRLLLR